MSSPRNIDGPSSRRKSIAKLTRSPLSSSPLMANSPRFGSKQNSFSNTQFLKRYEDSAIDSASSHSHSDKNSSTERLETRRFTDDVFSDDEGLAIPGSSTSHLNQINKYLHSDPIQSEGGDITRDLYKMIDTKRPTRTRSLSSSEFESSRRGSMASEINVPGGFRRQFLVNTHKKTEQASLFTSNFIEFLSIYGHFAGEDLETEDDIACHYEPKFPKLFRGVDEESPLLDTSEDDPFRPDLINPKGTATDTKAYFLLVKAFVGTGVLFLPRGFGNGGLMFSILTLIFFGILSYWCYLILVLSKQQTRVSSFGEIGLKLYGRWLQQLIFSSIVISQVGFIATYIVFTSQNVQALMNTVLGFDNIPIKWFILAQLFILIPLSLIRDITKLSLVAVLANFLILGGLVTIIYFVLLDLFIGNGGHVGDGIQFLFNKKEFSMFIGIAIFAFEGIGLIIPIQDSMIYPNHFKTVLMQVIITISIIMIGVGTLGYCTYGKSIQTVIILNLPQDSIFIIFIQLFYSLAILLSTPIQIFPAIRLVESKLFVRTGKNSLTIKWLKNLFRGVFVAFTAVVALYGGNNLDKFVSFVGCFACIPLVYMYPPMLHLRSCCLIDVSMTAQQVRVRKGLAYLNYVLVLIGACALVYTTYDILAN